MITIAVTLSVVFFMLCWIILSFFALYAFYFLPLSFFLLLLIGLLLVGSPDEAMQEWHKKQSKMARDLYATLYNQSPVPYLTVNTNNKITIANQAAVRLFDIPAESLLGTDVTTYLSDDDDIHLSVVLGKMSAGATVLDSELTLTVPSGAIKYVSLSVFTNETFDQRLLALVDITQHKIVDKAKSEFVALATHQLRTPIAAIRWNVELLERSLRTIVNEKQTNYLLKISRNVTRMIALINDFLSVSKLETGTFATSPESIELSTYLPTIVEEFEGQIREKNILLTTTYEPSPFTITADARLFHIIASNLLSNAVKYVRAGDGIAYGYTVANNELVLTVADTGIGIPADQLSQLFTKFFRASNAMQHRAEGTGLGLYIVKQSVEQLGGTIAVTSTEGKGTTFVVRLPVSSK